MASYKEIRGKLMCKRGLMGQLKSYKKTKFNKTENQSESRKFKSSNFTDQNQAKLSLPTDQRTRKISEFEYNGHSETREKI